MALPLWIEFFDELQNVRGRSQNTVKAYRRDLETYENFKAKHKNITKIYDYLTKQGLKQRSQARVISSIRTYLRFCERNGVDAPDLRELRLPKIVNALPKVLSKSDFQKLLSACKVDDENKILEITYLKENLTKGKQVLRFEKFGNKTKVIHTSYYDCQNKSRNKLYPHFHKQLVDAFHENLKKIIEQN